MPRRSLIKPQAVARALEKLEELMLAPAEAMEQRRMEQEKEPALAKPRSMAALRRRSIWGEGQD